MTFSGIVRGSLFLVVVEVVGVGVAWALLARERAREASGGREVRWREAVKGRGIVGGGESGGESSGGLSVGGILRGGRRTEFMVGGGVCENCSGS